MLKELVLAIILGGILGFGLTGSAVGLKNALQKDVKKPTITIPTSGPTTTITINLPTTTPAPTTPSPTDENTLTITKPDMDSVSVTEDITIVGKGLPNSLILASTSSKSSQVNADSAGEFILKLKLDGGRNEVQVYSFSETKEIQTKLFVTYSNARF